jgi:16S rRNA (guanine1207-N2)-methyltransferase
MKNDPLPLNERAAQILLDILPNSNVPVLCSDAVWPIRPRPHLSQWQRRSGTATDFTVWDKTYAAALLGLPRAREELTMNLHFAAARLLPDAPLVLFGLKDAGIAAAERVLQDLFVNVTLALTKFHGRVFIARTPRTEQLIDGVDDWRRANTVNLLGKEVSLVSFPGLFAEGMLDSATALLMAQLSSMPAPKIVLDYACGTGVLALAAQQLWPEARLHLLDHDALALRAARWNIGRGEAHEAEYVQAENMAACSARYDLIVSNPPIHLGVIQNYDVVEQLVMDAPNYLARGGKLVLVTQKTVPVQRWAKNATVIAQEEAFKVWVVTA